MGASCTYSSPAQNAKFTVGDNILFQFTLGAGGGNPILFCDTSADPTTELHSWTNTGAGTYSWTWVPSTAGTYNWKIAGSLINSPGVWSFTVYAAAPKATSPNPANNATGIALNQQLSFSRPSGAVKADVWLKIGSGSFNKIASATTATSINPGALTGNTTYQWRIDTYNGADHLTTGDTWQFSTLTSPTKATNPSPANSATGISLHPTLSWTRPGSATSCDVWFGPSGNMTKVLSGTTNTTYSPATLTGSTQYQWRIDTINGAGTTQGDTWGFTTIAPPDVPASPNPANGTLDVARNQDISWSASARATSYRVYFSTSQADVEAQNAGAQQVPDITATSWDTGLMAVNTNYYWRIVAINEAGNTAGPVWTFRIGTPVIADPVIRNYKKRLCALSNNKFWYSDNNTPTAMTSLTIDFGGGYALDTSKPCAMLEAFQKVYIINDGRYFVVDFCNVKITATQAFDYASNYVPERGSLLYGNSGGVMLVDYVDKTSKFVYGFITNGSFAASNTVTGADTGGKQTNFTVSAVTLPTTPHIYKWQPYPNRLSSTGNEYGIMPTHSTILRMYRGRVVLAGDKNAPHQWYMSEQANFYNWAYGSEDQGAPVAGTDTDIGKIGDIIRAVIPYSDDFCLFGCSQTLWLLRGDPAVSASLDNVSYVVGIFSDTSWCFDDANNLYILNATGIYALGQGVGSPQSLTKSILPNFAQNFPVDDAIHQISMGYDRLRYGILITKTSDGDNQNYWLDLRNGGFFPEQYPLTCSATALHYYDAMVSSYRLLHIGGKDGYIRVFDDEAKTDDTIQTLTPIAAEMVIGPLPMSKTGSLEAMCIRLNITPANGTDQANYQIFTAKTAEEIIKAVEAAVPNSRISGIIKNVLKITRPRARGAYFAIRIYSDGQAHTWAIDNMSGEFTGLGRVL